MEEREVKISVDKETFLAVKTYITSKSNSSKVKKQKDEYFDTEIFNINNLNRGLRVRFNNSTPSLVEFKSLFFDSSKRADNPWFIEEISFPLPLTEKDTVRLNETIERLGFKSIPHSDKDYEELVANFAQIGLMPKITVTKEREEFELDGVEYIFDYIEELGYFIEIEVKDNSLDPLEIVENKLGIENNSYTHVRNGYNDMVANKYPNCLSNDIKQLLFKINPKWNVLNKEINLVNSLLSN